MGRGDVPLATRPDRERRPGATRGAEDETVTDDRRGNHFARHAARAPELRPCRRIVGLHASLAVDDQLVPITGLDDDRRAPPDGRRSIGLPQDLAGCRVECRDERAQGVCAAVILVEEDTVVVENRRARAAVVVFEIAELLVPHEPALEVEGRDPMRAERGVNSPTVGRGRCRCVAVLGIGVLDAR